MILNKYFSN